MPQPNCRPQEYARYKWRKGYAPRSVGFPAVQSTIGGYESSSSVEIAGWQPTPSNVIEQTKTALGLQGIPEELVDIAPNWLVYAGEEAVAALSIRTLFIGLVSSHEAELSELKLFSIGGAEDDKFVGHGFLMVGRSQEELMEAVAFLVQRANEQLHAITSPLTLPALPTE